MANPPINDPQLRNVGPTDFDQEQEMPVLANDEFVDPGVDADLAPGEPDIHENDDGSATITFDEDDDEPTMGDGDFLENLAEKLEEGYLTRLSVDMLEAFDRDRQSRKRRDEQYAEGIRRTGLGNDAPGGAGFDGASRAVHPILIEGCIEFSARSMKELFPPSGPVKTQLVGQQTEAKLAQAERKKTYMNWQLTKQIREYRSDLEQALTQVPLGGSQYIKARYDERLERPATEFVPVDEMLLPFTASDFYTASRKTHIQYVTREQFEGRVASGLYRDVSLGEPGMSPEYSSSALASERVEGKEDPSYNEDGLRMIYESYCELKVPGDRKANGDTRGYILTIDDSSQKVLALYRNWDEFDQKKVPTTLDWIVEFGFIPWRGAYKIGLSHIIGGLSGALTGALRALLDSAHIENIPGGLILKGARANGQNLNPDPTELTQIEGPANIDDIRKLAMPYPFKGPSSVLFQLMGWLTEQAKGVVTTASEAIKDAGNDMPVGTALALIEQGSITFSAVHARLHDSQKRMLEIIHRINGQYLNDKVTVEELGSLVVGRRDFQGPMDIIPVSDPNIFSDAQRYAQNQAAMQMAEKFPQAFKVPKLISRAMQLINYPAWEEVVNFPSDARKLDAVEENCYASDAASQLKNYPDQDDLTHLQLHLHFMSSPIFGSNPVMALPALPKLLQHCKDHLLSLYKSHVRAAAEMAKHMLGEEGSHDYVVRGAAFADQNLAQQLAPLMPLFQNAQQLIKQLMQPQPDPKTQGQIQMKTMETQTELQITQLENQGEIQRENMRTQGEGQRLQLKEQNQNQRQAAQLGVETTLHGNKLAQQDKEAGVNAQLEMQAGSQDAQRHAAQLEAEQAQAALQAQQQSADGALQIQLQKMRDESAQSTAAQQAQVQLMLAEIKAGREQDRAAMQQDFEDYKNRVTQQFQAVQDYLEGQHEIRLQEQQQAHELELERLRSRALKMADGGQE